MNRAENLLSELKNADIAMYQAKQAGGGQYQLCKKA
jgi:GGDEF domain-containing protein